MMLDLDITLVDRRRTFTRWDSDFVAGLDGDTTDLEWLIAADQDGYRPRAGPAALMHERFHLNTPVPDLVDRRRHELLEHTQAYPGVIGALETLVERGAVMVTVTNGTVHQQMRKPLRTGWVSHHQMWPHPWGPDVAGRATEDVLQHIMAQDSPG